MSIHTPYEKEKKKNKKEKGEKKWMKTVNIELLKWMKYFVNSTPAVSFKSLLSLWILA